MNQIEDTVGNYLTVSYTEDTANGSYRPASVDYAGHDGQSVAPYASVTFSYETRPDIRAPLSGRFADQGNTTPYRRPHLRRRDARRRLPIELRHRDQHRTLAFTFRDPVRWRRRLPRVPQQHGGREPSVGNPPDVLVGVTDSLGTLTDITYTPITDTAVYTKDTGGSACTYPCLDVQGPMYVVSEVSTDDGLGGQARKTYAYGGAKADFDGRGFLGFRWMEVKDEQTGIYTTTDYRQDFPYTGQVSMSVTYLDGGATLKRLVNTWSSLSLNGGATQFPYVSASTAESYELNDGPGNSAITTVTTTSVYDTFGNPTSITVNTTGGGETFTKLTTNTYTNDTGNWFLGRLTRAEVQSTVPGTEHPDPGLVFCL